MKVLPATCLAALLAISATAGSVRAEDMAEGFPSVFEASAGIGVLGLEAHEYVFAATGGDDHISFLNWQSLAPVLNAGMNVAMPQGWTFAANAQAALSGDSHMADYDWTGSYFVDYSFDNWTHRSLHPNTSLDFYFNGSAAIGYNVVADGETTVNLNAGFKYIDSQWTAYDGTAVYSVGGFRDTSFQISGKGITYRQQFPTFFVGADSEMAQGDWTFSLGAKAGVTLGAQAIDNHWLRDLRFEDHFYPAPVLAASAGAEYDLSQKMSVFLKGTVDKVFVQRGDTDEFTISTGAYKRTTANSSGADLLAGTLTAGVKGSF